MKTGKNSLEILFEDQWIIVVNKPSGMLSIGFPGSRTANAQDLLTEMKRSKGKQRIAVVHRLDRDTSGVMMFACTAEAKKKLMDGWQKIVTERTYRCVCARLEKALPLEDKGTIAAPLAYNKNDVAFVPKPGDAKMLKEAEKAVTHYKVLERGEIYDLVECELETGKKNQIRAHMAYLGHPVIGDDIYGAKETGEAFETGKTNSASPIGRLALHARVLAFTHPFTGAVLRFELGESESFAKIIAVKKYIPRKNRVTTKNGISYTKAKPDFITKFPAKDRPGKKERLKENTNLKPLPRSGSRTKSNPKGESRFIPKKDNT